MTDGSLTEGLVDGITPVLVHKLINRRMIDLGSFGYDFFDRLMQCMINPRFDINSTLPVHLNIDPAYSHLPMYLQRLKAGQYRQEVSEEVNWAALYVLDGVLQDVIEAMGIDPAKALELLQNSATRCVAGDILSLVRPESLHDLALLCQEYAIGLYLHIRRQILYERHHSYTWESGCLDHAVVAVFKVHHLHINQVNGRFTDDDGEEHVVNIQVGQDLVVHRGYAYTSSNGQSPHAIIDGRPATSFRTHRSVQPSLLSEQKPIITWNFPNGG